MYSELGTLLRFSLFTVCLYVHSSLAQVSTAQWQSLNKTINGRLFSAIPFASPCFQSSHLSTGDFNETDCTSVQTHYLNGGYRSDFFAAYMNSQWETCAAASAQCLLNWENVTDGAAFDPPRVCQQGSISPYYIDVQSVEDVQNAFEFAAKNGVSLAIKNSGHDYRGRSSTPNSLGLWAHNLKTMTYLKNFVPAGCPATYGSAAVTLGAGVQHSDMYQFADEHNITLPGGGCITVGPIGGFLQGGGHSPLSNIYGLAVDRVLQFEIVTPTGKHLFANPCQNQDLFWALRGGGGGTFGFVMAATMMALPQSSYVVVEMEYTANATRLRQFLSFLISNSVKWAKDGWSGQIRPAGRLVLANIRVTKAEAQSYMKSLRELTEKELGGTFSISTARNYLDFHNTFIQPDSSSLLDGAPEAVVSRLIPAATLSADPEELLDALVNAVNALPFSFIFADTPYNFKPHPTLGSASANPAWRSAIWHFGGGTAWNYNTPADMQKEIYANLTASFDTLRSLTPTSGAYHNEADVYEPKWSTSFWGNNYQKLVSIKRKYDPGHLLDCWQCVDWSGRNNDKFSCYV